MNVPYLRSTQVAISQLILNFSQAKKVFRAVSLAAELLALLTWEKSRAMCAKKSP